MGADLAIPGSSSDFFASREVYIRFTQGIVKGWIFCGSKKSRTVSETAANIAGGVALA